MEEFVFLSALNQYDYCPRRCYYIFVENVFVENEHTVEGTLQHARANSGESSTRDGAIQTRVCICTHEHLVYVVKPT